jgi:general secretion pathway protein D
MPLAAFGQFDFGGGATDNSKPWDHFKLPKNTVKLDLGNASVDAVIALYEKVSGITIIKDPSLTGKMSITSAKPVNLATAFQILSTTLSLKGFNLEFQDSLLVIRSRNQAQPQRGFDSTIFPQGGPGGDNSQILKVYPITYANATQVARVINDVFAPSTGGGGGFNFGNFGGRGPGGGGPGGFNRFNGGPGGGFQGFQGFNRGAAGQETVKASSDDFSNSVIINGSQRIQDQVAAILKQIDKQTDQPQTSRVYRLTYGSATDVASVVQNVLVSNAPQGRGGQTNQNSDFGSRFQQAIRLGSSQAAFGQVATDARTNSLVVTATQDNQDIVARVIRELDTPVDVQTATFVFPLQNAKATDVSNLLLQAFGQRQGVTNNRTTSTSSTHVTTVPTSSGSSSSSTTRSGSPGGLGLTPDGQVVAANTGNIVSPQVNVADSTDGQNVPVQLQDPTAQAGELMTEIGVQGGFFGGGGGQRGGGGGFGGQSGSSSSQNSTTTIGRDSSGQLVNIRDLTGQVTAIPDPNTNSLIVVTTPDGAAIIKSVLAQLDKIPQQVVIQTMIIEASLDAADQLGMELSGVMNKVFGQTGSTATGTTNFGLANASPALTGFSGKLSAANLTAFVNALKTDTRYRVLSTPRIFTSNNVTAEINISQSIPYVLSSVLNPTTNTYTYNYAFLDVGIILTVTPQITSNGYVTMDVTQTANDLQGYTSFNAPIVNQRQATTTVSVKDNETVVIGGIIQHKVTSTVNKVPILGDIPILGNLFRSTNRDDNKTELLVFMTPQIINNDADALKNRDQAINQLGPDTKAAVKQSIKDGVLPVGNAPTDLPPNSVPAIPKQKGQ